MAAINPGPIQQKPTEAVNPGPIQQSPTEAVNPGPIQQSPTQAVNPGPIQQQPTDQPTQPVPATQTNPPQTSAVTSTPAAQQTQNDARTTQESAGKIYKVGANGQAPKGLSVGDQVVTAAGTYTILAVNPDGTYRSQLTNANQTTANYAGSYHSFTTPTGNVYRAGADGNAPSGLNVGDQVVTSGGTYIIDAINKDGTYVTTLINADIASGNYRGEYTRDPNAPADAANPADRMKALLEQWRDASQQQAENKINYTVETGINELNRAMEDAQPKFREQLNTNDIDTARALDNSALYAEARGDRGGIGQAQYNEIQAAALKNRQAINTAQTKLATDTARQIQDLRMKGEFEKADKLLALSQNYLAQLISLEQWGAQWQTTREEMARELEQWEKNYAIQLANLTGTYNGAPTYSAQKTTEASAQDLIGAALKYGIRPSDALIRAAGYGDYAGDVASIANSAAYANFNSGSGGGQSSRVRRSPKGSDVPAAGGGGGGTGAAIGAAIGLGAAQSSSPSARILNSSSDSLQVQRAKTDLTIKNAIANGESERTVLRMIETALEAGLIIKGQDIVYRGMLKRRGG